MAASPESARGIFSDYQAVPNDTMELKDVHLFESHELLMQPPPSATAKPYDKSLSICTACLVGLGFSYGVVLASIAVSIYLYKKDHSAWNTVISNSPGTRTVLDLVISALVTLCTEAMGYIHTVVLRWTLLREGRLRYSSNLRLLSSARRFWPNSRWANLLSSIGLVLSYAGASQTLVHWEAGGGFASVSSRHRQVVNGPALLVLGLGLLVQALISTACLVFGSAHIPTWSSNILTVTLACIRERPDIFRREEGRCLRSAYDTVRVHDSDPIRPRLRQPSIQSTDPAARHIVRFVWFLTGASFLWGIIVIVLIHTLNDQTHNVVAFFPAESDISSAFLVLGIVAVFQALATMGLHSVELLVNRSRDEQCWRHASRFSSGDGASAFSFKPHSGSRKRHNSIVAAMTSWQSMTLYILKPFIHWLFGSSLVTSNDDGSTDGYMDYHFIFPLAITVLGLAVFASLLSSYQPRGVIPSSWGYIQALTNLIDDWGDESVEELYWGDKGLNSDGTRHAGTTSNAQLGDIVMDAEYR